MVGFEFLSYPLLHNVGHDTWIASFSHVIDCQEIRNRSSSLAFQGTPRGGELELLPTYWKVSFSCEVRTSPATPCSCRCGNVVLRYSFSILDNVQELVCFESQNHVSNRRCSIVFFCIWVRHSIDSPFEFNPCGNEFKKLFKLFWSGICLGTYWVHKCFISLF